jgi:hypothetical protein
VIYDIPEANRHCSQCDLPYDPFSGDETSEEIDWASPSIESEPPCAWKQWSAVKKAVIAAIKKQIKREVKSLVSWQHHRKQLIAG